MYLNISRQSRNRYRNCSCYHHLRGRITNHIHLAVTSFSAIFYSFSTAALPPPYSPSYLKGLRRLLLSTSPHSPLTNGFQSALYSSHTINHEANRPSASTSSYDNSNKLLPYHHYYYVPSPPLFQTIRFPLHENFSPITIVIMSYLLFF